VFHRAPPYLLSDISFSPCRPLQLVPLIALLLLLLHVGVPEMMKNTCLDFMLFMARQQCTPTYAPPNAKFMKENTNFNSFLATLCLYLIWCDDWCVAPESYAFKKSAGHFCVCNQKVVFDPSFYLPAWWSL
jgi:hypothetical protein